MPRLARFVRHTTGPGYRIDAEHVLTPRGEGTEVLLRLTLSGPLSGVLRAMVGARIRRCLAAEAAALKVRREAPGEAG